MRAEQMRVLEMLQEGKITAEQAAKLLEALEGAEVSSLGPGPSASRRSRLAQPSGQATSSSSSAPRWYCSSGG